VGGEEKKEEEEENVVLQHSEHVKTIIVLPVTKSSMTAKVLALYRTNVTLHFKSLITTPTTIQNTQVTC
jgi:hypothetical protein